MFSINKGGVNLKGLGWGALVLGVLVVIFAWATTGSTQQTIQTILGILTAIVGIVGLTGK